MAKRTGKGGGADGPRRAKKATSAGSKGGSARAKKKPSSSTRGAGVSTALGTESHSRVVRLGRGAVRAATSIIWWRSLLLVTLSGAMVFLSYPNYELAGYRLYGLQWFSLVPLLWVLEGKRNWSAFGWGLWAGVVTNWGGFWWFTGMLIDFGHIPVYLAVCLCTVLCACQGLLFAFWAWFTVWLSRTTRVSLFVIAPTAWVVVELFVPFMFPWYFGNGQYLFYPVIQIAEVTGVYGVSFLLVLFNVGIYRALRLAQKGRWQGAWTRLFGVALVLALNVGWGMYRIAQVDAEMAKAPTLRLGLIEADVGIYEKEAKSAAPGLRQRLLQANVLKHQLLAAEAETVHEVDLIVAPESSFIAPNAVQFKRSELFAVAAGEGRNVWELHGDHWKGPQITERSVTAIHDISASREDTIVAVGAGGVILRYDAGDWVTEDSGVSEDLHGVAVSGAPGTQFDANFYARLDGWPSRAVAVGDKGTALFRQDGTWRATDSGTELTLRAVAGAGQEEFWVVGDRGIVLRWNGIGWAREEVPSGVNLNGIWAAGEGRLTVVGDQGRVLERAGGRWTPADLPGTPHLYDVVGRGKLRLVVGARGSAFLQTSEGWSRMNTGTDADLRAVAWEGRRLFRAAGAEGTLLRWDGQGTDWEREETPRGAGNLRALVGLPFTIGHTYGRRARYLYRSDKALAALPERSPEEPGQGQGERLTRLETVEQMERYLPLDTEALAIDWNTPLRGYNTPILFGLVTYDTVESGYSPLLGPNGRLEGREGDDRAGRRTFNSAFLLEPNGRVLGRYDKNHLLVFGEYLPFGDWFPQLYDMLPQANHFTPGDTVEPIDFQGHRLGVIICYEDILPAFTRNLAGKDPNVLINVTNDAWFGKTSEPALHLALSVFRSVEHRLWLIRSTNTGISAFVDGVGRIVAGTRLEDPEVLVRDVPMMRSSTIYRRYGDLFAYACLLVFSVLAVGGLARRARA